MTDAERSQKALHKLDVDWGNGTFDYAGLRAILVGDKEEGN